VEISDFNFLTAILIFVDEITFTLRSSAFQLAVRDPKKSAQWFQRASLRKGFEFENGVAVGNENVTIVLFEGKPSPEARAYVISPRTWPTAKALDRPKARC
jgi:hypothetical protein